MTGVWILLVVMRGTFYTQDFNSEADCNKAGAVVMDMGKATGVAAGEQAYACVWKGKHDYTKKPRPA